MRDLVEHKRNHPWVNDRCRRAIRERDSVAQADLHADAMVHCNQVMVSERDKWVQHVRVREVARTLEASG